MEWAWLIPVFSFAAAPAVVIFGKYLPGKGSWLSILAIGGGFVVFWLVLDSWLGAHTGTSGCFTSENTGMLTCDYERIWFNAGIVGAVGSVSLNWGILIDPLTIAMLGLVTFVAFMVQVYSLSYMKGDPRFGWYFAVHSLFAAAMLTGMFSLLSACLFTLMDAVDVAFTEAAVGAGISTVLILGTLAITANHEKKRKFKPRRENSSSGFCSLLIPSCEALD